VPPGAPASQTAYTRARTHRLRPANVADTFRHDRLSTVHRWPHHGETDDFSHSVVKDGVHGTVVREILG